MEIASWQQSNLLSRKNLTKIQKKSIPQKSQLPNQALSIESSLGVKKFGLVKEFLERKVMEFQSRSIKSKLDQWKLLTFDPEVLETVFGRPISIALEDLPPVKTCKYLFNKKETKSIEEELDNLMKEN